MKSPSDINLKPARCRQCGCNVRDNDYAVFSFILMDWFCDKPCLWNNTAERIDKKIKQDKIERIHGVD